MIVDYIRYALIHASINSLASSYDSYLVARAIQLSVWDVERALSIARKTPHTEQKLKLYLAILWSSRLPNGQREQVIEEIQRYTVNPAFEHYNEELSVVLKKGKPGFWNKTRQDFVYDKSLMFGLFEDIFLGNQDFYKYQDDIAAFNAWLRSDSQQEAIVNYLNNKRDENFLQMNLFTHLSRDMAFQVLAPILHGKFLVTAYHIGQRLVPMESREKTTQILSLYVDEQTIEDALRTDDFGDSYEQANVLIFLASLLPSDLQLWLLSHIIEILKQFPGDLRLAVVIETIIEIFELSHEYFAKIVGVTLTISDPDLRFSLLSTLAYHMLGYNYSSKIELIHSMIDPDMRDEIGSVIDLYSLDLDDLVGELHEYMEDPYGYDESDIQDDLALSLDEWAHELVEYASDFSTGSVFTNYDGSTSVDEFVQTLITEVTQGGLDISLQLQLNLFFEPHDEPMIQKLPIKEVGKKLRELSQSAEQERVDVLNCIVRNYGLFKALSSYNIALTAAHLEDICSRWEWL